MRSHAPAPVPTESRPTFCSRRPIGCLYSYAMADAGSNDPRVHFAAERTFLAWIRTGLSLMGFGFVVARFGLFLKEVSGNAHMPGVKSYGFSLWAGSAMVLLGAMMNLAAVARHLEVIRRINRGESIVTRPSFIAIAVGIVLGLVGIAMVVFLLAVSLAVKPAL